MKRWDRSKEGVTPENNNQVRNSCKHICRKSKGIFQMNAAFAQIQIGVCHCLLALNRAPWVNDYGRNTIPSFQIRVEAAVSWVTYSQMKAIRVVATGMSTVKYTWTILRRKINQQRLFTLSCWCVDIARMPPHMKRRKIILDQDYKPRHKMMNPMAKWHELFVQNILQV